MIAYANVQFVGKFASDNEATIRHVEFSFDDVSRNDGDIRFEFGNHAANPGRSDLRLAVGRLSFQQHLFHDQRRDRFYASIFFDDDAYLLVIGHRVVAFFDFQVGIETENLVAKLLIEASHDADDNNQNRDAEGDS